MSEPAVNCKLPTDHFAGVTMSNIIDQYRITQELEAFVVACYSFGFTGDGSVGQSAV